jgi:dihydrofolate reductase
VEIVLIAVQSIDGFLTRHDEPGTGFASAEDQALFRELLAECDASVMGAATYEVARARVLGSLTADRLRIVMTSTPERRVEDQRGGQLEFTRGGPAEIVDRLRALGKRRLAVLGGGRVNRLFLQAGLVDALWITVEARVFGGGVPLSAGRVDAAFSIEEVRRLSDRSLFVRWKRRLSP